MRLWGLFIGFVAVVFLLIPSLPAQDEKKDEKGEEKKTEKKEPEKKEKKAEEKMPTGLKIGPVKLTKAEGTEFTVLVADEKRVFELNQWSAQQQYEIGRMQINNANDAQNHANRVNQYQMDLARRQNDIYSKPLEFHAADGMKVRFLTPPPTYDDTGRLKKWTQKELVALKGTSKLVGYPGEVENLQNGQYVEVYFAKVAPPKVTGKKKNDPPSDTKPEAVMIVVTQNVKLQ